MLSIWAICQPSKSGWIAFRDQFVICLTGVRLTWHQYWQEIGVKYSMLLKLLIQQQLQKARLIHFLLNCLGQVVDCNMIFILSELVVQPCTQGPCSIPEPILTVQRPWVIQCETPSAAPSSSRGVSQFDQPGSCIKVQSQKYIKQDPASSVLCQYNYSLRMQCKLSQISLRMCQTPIMQYPIIVWQNIHYLQVSCKNWWIFARHLCITQHSTLDE